MGKAAETLPDVVLMDLRLRGKMNGIESARQIREVRLIPVVYVTAHATAVADTAGGSGAVLPNQAVYGRSAGGRCYSCDLQ